LGDTKGVLTQKNPSISRVLADPAASNWLKQSLQLALAREPLAAANDAARLSQLLDQRCNEQIYRAISTLAILQAKNKS
jgi:hypothetical protein